MDVELLSVDGVFRSRIRRFRPPVLRRFRRRRIRNGREMKFPPDRDFSGIDVREATGHLGKLRYGRERHGAWDGWNCGVLLYLYREENYIFTTKGHLIRARSAGRLHE